MNLAGFADEEGMGIFPLVELEIDEKESDKSEIRESSEIREETTEPKLEVNNKTGEVSAEVEATQVIEPAEVQPSVIAQLESQDLSSLEAELIQPEIEAEPKIEEVEPEEAQGY